MRNELFRIIFTRDITNSNNLRNIVCDYILELLILLINTNVTF